MAENGKLAPSALAPIPGGELAKEAAAAWNAPGGPASAGLYPTGSMSSYRTYAEQVYLYKLYEEGRGNLAAYPGTSNHGLGIAVDLAAPWMRTWIDEHGAKYGWRKTEAPSEWWHVNYVGGVSFPTFKPLHRHSKGRRVVKLTKRLRFLHRPHGHAYLPRFYYEFKGPVVEAVCDFQRDHGLSDDGEVGIHTHQAIEEAFEKQWGRRGK